MSSSHTQNPGFDIGLRRTLQPTRVELSVGIFDTSRSYTMNSNWSGSNLRSTDVGLLTVMPQLLLGYRCDPKIHDRSTTIAQVGMNMLIPYRTKLVRHLSDGTTQDTDDAPVDYQTGFSVRTGLRYVRSISRILRASVELQGAYMVAMNYVEGYDKFNSWDSYNLTTDRGRVSILLGFGLSDPGRSVDPEKVPN